MITLEPHECRVLGVLVEKAQTTPQQYPMTLNSIVNGCNQKSNRDPVLNLNEDQVLRALDTLRGKQLVREVMLSGSRVAKYKHNAREALDIGTNELVVLTELMLRGPQTLGEIRGRASRMHPIESLEILQNILEHLNQREEPMAKAVPPAPGSRAGRFMQLLCPDLHRIESGGSSQQSASTAALAPRDTTDLEARVKKLEATVEELRTAVMQLTKPV